MVSKAQQACVNRYVKTKYDRINVTLPKGRKDELKVHAAGRGESVNAFIVRAINAQLEADSRDQSPG